MLLRRPFLIATVLTAVLAALVPGLAAAGERDADATGPVLMSHRTVDLAGEPVSLADYAGEVLVVNFWASWCAPCRTELPLLDAWNADWQQRGGRVVAISIDSKAGNATSFAAKAAPGLTVWHDGPRGLAAALDLPAVPTSYVIDRQGRVVLRIEGSSPEDLAKLQQTVESLLGDRDGRPSA